MPGAKRLFMVLADCPCMSSVTLTMPSASLS
jgi:hypothetical protein